VPRFGTVLLDLDGTMVDTVALIREAHRHAVTTVLGHDLPDEELLANVGRPLLEQMQAFDRRRADELLHAQRTWNHAHTRELIAEYPGMHAMLAGLRAGGSRVGVVTSKMRGTVQLAFDALPHVAAQVDALIAVEDTTRHKPAPEPVLAGLAALGGTPGDACYVGDAPFDIAAGNAAGVVTIGVTWGFFPREALADAHVVFDDVAALEEYLMEDPQAAGEGT
jgi:pyrophosphatase PpaX